MDLSILIQNPLFTYNIVWLGKNIWISEISLVILQKNRHLFIWVGLLKSFHHPSLTKLGLLMHGNHFHWVQAIQGHCTSLYKFEIYVDPDNMRWQRHQLCPIAQPHKEEWKNEGIPGRTWWRSRAACGCPPLGSRASPDASHGRVGKRWLRCESFPLRSGTHWHRGQ